jgi:hypothetical protein
MSENAIKVNINNDELNSNSDICTDGQLFNHSNTGLALLTVTYTSPWAHWLYHCNKAMNTVLSHVLQE